MRTRATLADDSFAATGSWCQLRLSLLVLLVTLTALLLLHQPLLGARQHNAPLWQIRLTAKLHCNETAEPATPPAAAAAAAAVAAMPVALLQLPVQLRAAFAVENRPQAAVVAEGPAADQMQPWREGDTLEAESEPEWDDAGHEQSAQSDLSDAPEQLLDIRPVRSSHSIDNCCRKPFQ